MHWNLIGADSNASTELADWTVVPVQGGEFRLRFVRLTDGPRSGVEVLEIATGNFRTAILPTRGMSLWKAWCDDWEIGWQSPVAGPIHPSLIRIDEPSGLGWLDGFDELVVRCGLESNGAPDFEAGGKLKYPLHGKIGNLPARRLDIAVDPEAGTLQVVGLVSETRFLIQSLEMRSEYIFRVNEAAVACVDTITNRSARAASMQLLYHINVGAPLLQAGSRVVAAFEELAPRDARAAEGIDGWDSYLGPAAGYAEQVYFAKPIADEQGWSTSVLHDAEVSRGVSVGFKTTTLPYLNLWKNTTAEVDGYVTGLEPATGFPNPRSFEAAQNRVVPLAAGESRKFEWRIAGLANPAELKTAVAAVESQRPSDPLIHRLPKPGWSNV